MTLTLILIRHAKSDWDDPRLTDHQRPLNARGRRAAPRVGAWIADMGLTPQQALVSDAMRTRETWHSIASHLPAAPAPALSPTGATTVLEFDVGAWAEVQPGMGRIRGFAIPRDLPDPE